MVSVARLIVAVMVLSASMVSRQALAAIPSTTNTWLQLPNTKLMNVCPNPLLRPDLFGPNITPRDCHTITSQWSGGTWDERNNRLIILGGGHGTYYGNEPYALDLNTQTLVQLDTPPPASATSSAATNCSIMTNGELGGRHTYSNLAWVDHLNVLVLVGGAGSCTAGSTEEDLWVWSNSAKTWTRSQPDLRASVGFNSSAGGTDAGVVYDTVRQRVWFHDCWKIYEYNVDTNTVITHTMSNGCQGLDSVFYMTWSYDPTRNRYFGVGEGRVVHVTVGGSGSYSWVSQSTSGSQTCVGARAPGLAYDPVQDRYVCWQGGNTVYVLNPSTWAWSTLTVSGTPPRLALESNGVDYGTYGRFQYSQKENAFVFCGDVATDCYALRLTAGGGGGGTSDTTAPSVPSGLSATVLSSSQINLTWSASTDNVGIAGYRVYRNGTQVGTPTGTSYSDTGLSPSTTYVYTVAAYDAAGNQSSQSSSASATTLSQSTGGSDFQSRCSAPGVLVCRGWDSPSEFTPPAWPNSGLYPAGDGLYHGTYDSSIKASGNGSLRFEILGGTQANSAGAWWEKFGRSFGSGETFYVQFRQRFSPEMLGVNMGGNGYKQVIFHSQQGGSCAALELTTQNTYYRGFAQLYTDCGAFQLDYGLNNGDYVLQYSNVYPPGSDGTIYCLYGSLGNSSNKCLYYRANDWMTFSYRVTVGSWGQPNSIIQAWAGYDGQPLTQIINRTNYTLNQDAPGLGFDMLQLTPYDSRKDGRQHATAYTWYDELIISTQPIAAPSGGGGTPNPPPAPPTNLRIQ